MKLFSQTGERGTVFAVVSDFAEKDVVKAAGFWWHPSPCSKPGCLACAAGLRKGWWTPKIEVAIKFRRYYVPKDGEENPFAKLDKTIDASRAANSDVQIPCPEGLSYLGYQKAGVAYAIGRPNTLIADEMGLGKTIQALGLVNAQPLEHILVVCPKSVKLNWQREAEKWLVDPRDFFQVSSVDDATRACEAYEKSLAPSMTFVNYEQLIKPAIWGMLMQVGWDLLVCDEAQKLKNPLAKQTIAVLGQKAIPKKKQVEKHGLRHRAARLLLLTGTPILNRPVESQNLLAACDPQFEGFGFLMRYCDGKQVAKGGKLVWDFDGASHLDELQTKARASCMVRRLKKDVLKELPPKRRQIVVLDPSGQRKLIDKENALAGKDYEEQVWELGNAAKHPHFFALAEARHELGLAKVAPAVEHIQELLEGLAPDGKVIVFAHHKDVVQGIANGLETNLIITGDTKTADRQMAVDEFQQGTGRVIVGTIGAMGVGLTMTAAQHVVFVELSHVPADVSQGEDRAHRIGQQGHVQIQHLVFDGSLDSRMVKRLLSKQAIIDMALDTQAPQIEMPIVPPAPTPKVYPVVAPEVRQRALESMRFLAARCDGACSKDGQGFSKIDVEFGKSLAAKSELTDGQVFYAQRLMVKYQRQLQEFQ